MVQWIWIGDFFVIGFLSNIGIKLVFGFCVFDEIIVVQNDSLNVIIGSDGISFFYVFVYLIFVGGWMVWCIFGQNCWYIGFIIVDIVWQYNCCVGCFGCVKNCFSQFWQIVFLVLVGWVECVDDDIVFMCCFNQSCCIYGVVNMVFDFGLIGQV